MVNEEAYKHLAQLYANLVAENLLLVYEVKRLKQLMEKQGEDGK